MVIFVPFIDCILFLLERRPGLGKRSELHKPTVDIQGYVDLRTGRHVKHSASRRGFGGTFPSTSSRRPFLGHCSEPRRPSCRPSAPGKRPSRQEVITRLPARLFLFASSELSTASVRNENRASVGVDYFHRELDRSPKAENVVRNRVAAVRVFDGPALSAQCGCEIRPDGFRRAR